MICKGRKRCKLSWIITEWYSRPVAALSPEHWLFTGSDNLQRFCLFPVLNYQRHLNKCANSSLPFSAVSQNKFEKELLTITELFIQKLCDPLQSSCFCTLFPTLEYKKYKSCSAHDFMWTTWIMIYVLQTCNLRYQPLRIWISSSPFLCIIMLLVQSGSSSLHSSSGTSCLCALMLLPSFNLQKPTTNQEPKLRSTNLTSPITNKNTLQLLNSRLAEQIKWTQMEKCCNLLFFSLRNGWSRSGMLNNYSRTTNRSPFCQLKWFSVSGQHWVK